MEGEKSLVLTSFILCYPLEAFQMYLIDPSKTQNRRDLSHNLAKFNGIRTIKNRNISTTDLSLAAICTLLLSLYRAAGLVCFDAQNNSTNWLPLACHC